MLPTVILDAIPPFVFRVKEIPSIQGVAKFSPILFPRFLYTTSVFFCDFDNFKNNSLSTLNIQVSGSNEFLDQDAIAFKAVSSSSSLFNNANH